jgi:MFS family permease
MLRALRSRNFRLFFAGQGISLVGTWLQQVALGWLVYRLTGSAFVLGMVGFLGQLPGFLIAPFGGVLADRWSRYPTLLVTQSAAMIQALVLASLVLSDRIGVWAILGLSAFIGVVNGVDIPTRQAFLVDMVERKEDLANAIALNSSMFNGARLVGPALAGIVIAAVGEGLCFLLNGISYVAVLGALLAMRLPAHPRPAERPRMVGQLVEGLRYAFGSPAIRSILLLLAVVSLVGMPYTVLMPVVAADVLHGGPATLGVLMASIGVGALLGALYLASRPSVLGLGRLAAVASSVFALGLIAFSLSRAVWLSAGLLAVTGLGMMVHMGASNTILQTIVEPDKRGRVMSLYTMAFLGAMPIGSLLAGALAGRIGAPNTVAVGGIVSLAASLAFASRLARLREHVRPLYVELGLIPAGAGARETAAGPTAPPEDP